MNTRFIKLALIGSCLAASAGACSGNRDPSSAQTGATGTIGMALTIPAGISISELTWTIHNPALLASDRTGTVDVSRSATVGFVVGGLPAGGGYTITISGTTSNGIGCTATAAFSVAAGATTSVSVNVVCTNTAVDAGETGSVSITGTVTVDDVCAAVTALSASPSTVNVGGAIELQAEGVDGAGNSADVKLAWALTGGTGTGTFDDPNSASPAFTCTRPGAVTVTVTATVSDGGAQCTNNTASVTLTCTAGEATADASLPSPDGSVLDAKADAPSRGAPLDSGPLPRPTARVHPCVGSSIKEFTLPETSSTVLPGLMLPADPYGLTTDGTYVIFTETQGNQIGFMDPSGNLTWVGVPSENSQPHGIAVSLAGPVPTVYFTEYATSRIGYFPYGMQPLETPADAFEMLLNCPILANSPSCQPYGITVDLSGTVWWTEYGTGNIDSYLPGSGAPYASTPTTPGPPGGTPRPSTFPTGITAGYNAQLCAPGITTNCCVVPYNLPTCSPGNNTGDGVGVFFTEFETQVTDPVTGNTTAEGQVSAAFPNAFGTEDIQNIAGTQTPGATAIAFGPDGNAWFVAGNTIGEIFPTANASGIGFGGIRSLLIPIPANTDGTQDQAESITSGPDGNMWFTLSGEHVLGMVITSQNMNEDYPNAAVGSPHLFYAWQDISSPGTMQGGGNGIVTGPDGNLWFADPVNNSIDQLSFCP